MVHIPVHGQSYWPKMAFLFPGLAFVVQKLKPTLKSCLLRKVNFLVFLSFKLIVSAYLLKKVKRKEKLVYDLDVIEMNCILIFCLLIYVFTVFS